MKAGANGLAPFQVMEFGGITSENFFQNICTV